MSDQKQDPWEGDLLAFSKVGQTFTNLIKTITEPKVISIEAPFGQGKTFFRKAWAAQLRQSGEVVIEFDAQMADRAGDPVVSLLGAMVRSVPTTNQEKWKDVSKKALALGGIAARTLTRIVVRNAADELFEAIQGGVDAKLPENEILDKSIAEIGEGLSKYTSNLIASQLAAENAIQELPVQLDALRHALAPDRRVVVLIDELDRCHPEYAIALLEAMKLVFNRDGFVFCLMVNPQYLENIAQHRFGMRVNGETYMDKFINLRFTLRADEQALSDGTRILAKQILPQGTPYGADPAFSVESAANLAGELAKTKILSFREIKRVLESVEIAIRCYATKPLDLPLLVYIALRDVVRRRDGVSKTGIVFDFGAKYLPRIELTPEKATGLLKGAEGEFMGRGEGTYTIERFVKSSCAPLITLDDSLYVSLPPIETGNTHHDWAKILHGLAPTYISDHEKVLAMVHEIQA